MQKDISPNEVIINRISDRARNLFESRRLMCSEAVMVALNHELAGGLTEAQAIGMAAPFCMALGDSGCICGALSGAVMATGLFLGDSSRRRRRELRECGRRLHDSFKIEKGATCCRVLTKKVKDDKAAHFKHCAELTAFGAELAARLILEKRPGLAEKAAGSPSVKRSFGPGKALLKFFLGKKTGPGA